MDESRQRQLEDVEKPLDDLKERARESGLIGDPGTRAIGGPIPANTPEATLGSAYYGLPIIKPPVWEWMIAVYFFVGGVAGMSGLIAAGALLRNQFELARVAMWSAGIGGILSPILLTWDIGRPMRFINMLRVLKFQSPMSVGSWIVSGFGAFAVPGLALTQWDWHNIQTGGSIPAVHIAAMAFISGAGFFGIFLATYTGALVAATAVPAWHTHRAMLPFHFGMAGLGCAAAIPLLVGFHEPALTAIFFFSAASETLVQFTLELRKHGAADEALHKGKSGWTLRAGETLTGPLALILAGFGIWTAATISFLAGAIITRFGWLNPGRASASNPESVLAAQLSP